MGLSGRAMLALLVILGLHSATATQYTVGGNGGWTFQSTSNTVYTDQFRNIQLVVGDTLLFPFTEGAHDVWEIPETDLSSCNFANPIQTYNASDSIVTLTTPGTHAFACQIPGHCTTGGGMQLSVTVSAGAPTAAPSSPPTPAPVSPPTPAPVSPPTSTPATTPTSPPAPATTVPPPAPTSRGPAPTTEAPTASTEAPAPGPAGPEFGGSSIVSSGSAMVVAAIVAGFAAFLV